MNLPWKNRRPLLCLGLLMVAAALTLSTPAQAADQTAAAVAEDVPATIVDVTPVTTPPTTAKTGRGCDPRYSMSNAHVKICFERYGDKIWLLDKSADGRSAMGELYVTLDTRHEKCRNRFGAGHWGYCNYNFGEGHAVSFEGYTLDHDGVINIEHDHTGWKSECSGSSSLCVTSVPAGYPHPSWPTTLKDYCSHSPDSVSYPAGTADFRGACARHDVCYHGSTAKNVCDSAFRVRMFNTCDYRFPRPGSNNPTGISRGLCHTTAQAYYEAVKECGDGKAAVCKQTPVAAKTE